ncbi:hypothetical protein KGM_204621 [Danaus plexippus plexippus]|uniref:Uncharacterized protein n=1 Tax=Danaus plexippus plexippus TaxID=278856 RepID=A0A212EJT9_DANPL|nr:hypothetical protein KGM_204621 [Danaus plexippus plexippus]
MRREFILILLGIISVSTLSSLLTTYVQVEADKLLLDTVVGVVGAGNFSYWQLGHSGPLLVELTSLSGDADLYVSDSLRPSYEVDKNNFSSATCGADTVSIPAEFPRPIGIGVFGDWSNKVSEYSIQVFLDTSVLVRDESIVEHAKINTEKTEVPTKPPSKEKLSTKRGDDDRPRLVKFLSLLDMIVEMFFL